MPAVATNPGEIPRQAWVALGIVSLALYMSVLDASAVNIAFPSVVRDLDVSRSTLSWMISAYTITTASLLLIAGHLADSTGRRRVFAIALSVFVLGSAICALANGFEILIVGRVVQGAGAAGVMASSLAVVLPLFPPHRRSTAIGVWGSMASAGAATGPTVGAFLIDVSSWRAIFWVNVPIGALVIAMTIMRVPESKSDDLGEGRLDPLGVPMATSGVALLMLAIVQTETWGFTDWRTAVIALAGLVLIPAAVVRSVSHPRPAIELDLFRVRSFWPAVLTLTFYGAGFLAGFLTTTLYLQDLWGYSVWVTGLALSPGPVIATFTGMYSGRLAERVGHRVLVGTGIVCIGASYGFLALTATAEPDYVGRYLASTLLLGIGLGLSLANVSGYAMTLISPARYGLANATLRTVQQIAYAVGIAIVVVLLGTDLIELADYRRSWIWITSMFAIAAAIAITYFTPQASPQPPEQRSGAPSRSAS